MTHTSDAPAGTGIDPLLSAVAVGRRLTLTLSALSERVDFADWDRSDLD